MVNYNKGKIYQIIDKANTKRYIGSTTLNLLSQRFQQHKMAYKQWKQTNKGYYTTFIIFEEFGIENCQIELVEQCTCENKDQLNKKEGEYIRSLECVNKNIPNRTQKEHYIDNRPNIRTHANESIKCDLCNKSYKRCNKVHHEKSKKCIRARLVLKSEQEIAKQQNEEEDYISQINPELMIKEEFVCQFNSQNIN
jgi:hypothetical protein